MMLLLNVNASLKLCNCYVKLRVVCTWRIANWVHRLNDEETALIL